ncbi:MAG: hypothetical protein IJY78_05485 [Bacteroidaceae bacterium]|nr:hypothetical protein [Bacteroidaceae bacterium]
MKEIILQYKPEAHVVRYIKLEQIDEIFNERRKKAKDFAKHALTYEKDLKLADALTYYYWALSLLRSCPSGNDLKISMPDFTEMSLQQYIYSRFRNILQNTNMKATAKIEDKEEGTVTYTVNAEYDGKPTANFAYSYFNGEETVTTTLRDGVGDITVPLKFKMKELDLRAVYSYDDAANVDREVRDVLDNTPEAPLDIAELELEGYKRLKSEDINKVDAKLDLSKHETADVVVEQEKYDVVHYLDSAEAAPYVHLMEKVEVALMHRDYKAIQGDFTPDGYEMFNKLINYGHAKLLSTTVSVNFTRLGNEITCRSFPMSFTFKSSRHSFTENVVFRMNTDCKITEVSFELEKGAIENIMDDPEKQYTQEARQTLVNFLERYRTAYALKDIDYIEKIFSNDALIITGHVVKSAGPSDINVKNMNHVEYTRQSKSEYLRKLERVFNSNEFINIRFAKSMADKNDVKYKYGMNISKSNDGREIYGIQIEQDYYSTNYGDHGYLFLLLDMQKIKEPLIKVRAWQPDLDPNIRDGRLSKEEFQF